MAWQPSGEVWLLAHGPKAKEFMAPSDARAAESREKLSEDWERRKPVMVQACPWQRPVRPSGASAVPEMERAIIHPTIQSLAQALTGLAEAEDIQPLSALRSAAHSAQGAGTFLLSSSNALAETGQGIPVDYRGVLKCSRHAASLASELRNLQRAMGQWPLRVPRPLKAAEEVEGLSAFVQEFVRSSLQMEVGQRERHSVSLADLLRVGCRPLALEAREGLEHLELRLAVEVEDLATCGLPEIRRAAQQTAELLAGLASHAADDLPSSSSCASPYVSWSTALGVPQPEFKAPVGAAVQSLLELEPMLERHLLGKGTALARASPLHDRVRKMTEECCKEQFGTQLSEIIQSARGLRQRLQRLLSAESRYSDDRLPQMEVPSCWCHARLTSRRLLLRDGATPADFEICASGWSGLCSGTIYSDLARLLTDLTFEEDLATIYSADGHAGASVPPVLLGEHLGITTGAAAFLLANVAQEDSTWTNEALADLIQKATHEDRPFALADLAQMLSWLRLGRHGFRTTVTQVSEALVAWELPFKQRHERAPKVPKATRCQRQPEVSSQRAVHWGWQAVREMRDAAVDVLPVIQGDVDELWPLMWLVPSLHRALQLLGALHLSWMQKVWLLQHIRLLSDRLCGWLDSPTAAPGARALQVQVVHPRR
ncbi:unnamed protein product [Effrenium voratum]|uniref:Uncharacterized protein n=1 Tax=Effrenium voratum TaxID=2562239 RepID=A0AA36NJ25_9DINO|nr:unnamed protein product [Effrenium voratum]